MWILMKLDKGDISGVQKLINSKEYDFDRKNIWGSTALILARGRSKMMLIEAGADVDAVDDKKRTPLFYTALQSTEDTKMLIKYNTAQNKQDIYGRTTYFYATTKERKKLFNAHAEKKKKYRKRHVKKIKLCNN